MGGHRLWNRVLGGCLVHRRTVSRWVCAVVIGACALAFWPVAIRSQSGRADVYAHTGTVLDWVTGKPVQADVHAYSSEKGHSQVNGGGPENAECESADAPGFFGG